MNFKTSGDERIALDGATGALFVVLAKALQFEACMKKTTCFIRQRGFSPALFGKEVRGVWRSLSPTTVDEVKQRIALCWYARERGFNDFKDFLDNQFRHGALSVCIQEDFEEWQCDRKECFAINAVRLVNRVMQWRAPCFSRAEADFCAWPIACDDMERQRELNFHLFSLVTRVCKSVSILAEHIRRETGEIFLVKFTASDPSYSAI